MQRYAIEHVLNHDYIYSNFDEKMISDLISEISNFNRSIIILSDKNGTFDCKEKFYNVEYKIIDNWKEKTFETKVNLCDENFDFKVEASKRNDEYLDRVELLRQDIPRYARIYEFDEGKISYVFDQKLKVPQSVIYVFLRNETLNKNFMAYKVFLSLAEDMFIEKYSRMLINYHLEISTSINHEGILIKFEGFTGNITKACELFFKNFECVKMDRFEVIKKELYDYYSENIVQSPYERLSEFFGKNILNSKTSEECLEMLSKLKVEDVKFLENYILEILAVGNIEYEKIQKLFDVLKRSGKEFPKEYGEGKKVVEFLTNDRFNNLTALLYEVCDFSNVISSSKYSEHSDASGSYEDEYSSFDRIAEDKLYFIRRSAIGRLIEQMIHEDFFNELRTIEQLGYVVYTQVLCFSKKEYLSFIVQSEKEVSFVENRILKFIDDFKIKIMNMTPEDFESYKDGLIVLYEEPITKLESLSNFVWKQHQRTEIDLNFNRKMIEMIRSIQITDLLNTDIFETYYKVSSYSKE